MFIQLKFDSDIPIYEQLKNELLFGIAKGQLKPGDRLPSVRQLASDIGINLHTVNKAYKQLEEEGFLRIHRQQGAIVSPDGPKKADHQYKETLKELLRPIIAEATLRQMSKKDFDQLIQSIFEELGGIDYE
ncbi:MAG TPA: GntR family transcriptional regulator [Pseudogracilibacillus sp.]|nr:GntR family transcriptional regulator [Pseudogracilibacillus sp.]